MRVSPLAGIIGVLLISAPARAAEVVLDLKTAELSATWKQNVLSNTINNLHLVPGAHALVVTALDPGLILDRYEIAFAGAPRAYDPVPETRIAK